MRTSTSIWVAYDQEEKAQKLMENIEVDDEIANISRIEELYIGNGGLNFSIAQNDVPVSVQGEFIFSGSQEDRELVKELAEITGLGEEKLADDRGRISLGSQYAGKLVTVAVIDVDEGDEE